MEKKQQISPCDPKEPIHVQTLLQKFDNFEDILENAAFTATFLHYLFNIIQEYYSLLYIFAIQKYHRICETKNSMRNYNHINMEIYTVFIHEKSILSIPFHNSELIEKIEENIDSEECLIYFQQLSQHIVTEFLTKYVEKFKETIKMGLDVYINENKIHEDMDRLKELKLLENVNSVILNNLIRTQKSRCLPPQIQDVKCLQILHDFQIRAITQGLSTGYENFLFNKKYSYVIKNIETAINAKTYLSTQKVSSPNKQKIRGHTYEEHSMSRVSFCCVCNLILWGSDPQCLYCRTCKNAIHRECKESVKNCATDSKTNRKNEAAEIKFDKVPETEDNQKDLELNYPITQIETGSNQENDENFLFNKSKDWIKIPRKLSLSKFQEFKIQCSSPFTSDKSRRNSKSGIKCTKSLNSKSDAKKAEDTKIIRSGSARAYSPERNLSQEINKLHLRSTSEDSGLASLVESSNTLLFDGDIEMNVPETFEPQIESKGFSIILNDTVHKGEYLRRLVLMEFHHKIKFTRMTLKRFKYLLVDPWLRMGEYLHIFDALSLYTIEKLHTLIDSLVYVIDSCKGEESYDSSMANKVLSWISEDDDHNRQCWFQLSTDLCCTNILHSIKSSWIEHKQISPQLNDLFSVEVNRLVIIEQLSNMRSLLFNLPMIVTKIVKDLNRFSKFKEEAKIWEQVGQKLSLLPQLIDERCMPLVDLINNGTILSSSIKYKECRSGKDRSDEMRTYIENFPKFVFKNNFFDFKFVKISNLRESYHTEVNQLQSSEYVKEETDAAIICYDTKMIILQKENDKFLLKIFKSPDANKLFPVIPFDNVHLIKHTIKENKNFENELTVLIINRAILVQILFREKRVRDMWFDHIVKSSERIKKNAELNNQNSRYAKGTFERTYNFTDKQFTEDITDSPSTSVTSEISKIRTGYSDCVNQFVHSFRTLSKELSENEVHDRTIEDVEQCYSLPKDFMFSYMNILKEYAIIGSQMIDQSKYEDSESVLQKDVVLMSLSKIKDITEEMTSLIQSQEQLDDTGTDVETDESTLENEETEDDDILSLSIFNESSASDTCIESQNQPTTDEFDC